MKTQNKDENKVLQDISVFDIFRLEKRGLYSFFWLSHIARHVITWVSVSHSKRRTELPNT